MLVNIVDDINQLFYARVFPMRKNGFTLLEMIITLAIMGVAMMSVIKYKERGVDEARRQLISNAIFSEINGLLTFVAEEKVLAIVAGKEKEITNPLYGSAIEKPYTNRTSNRGLNDALSTQHNEFIDWGAGSNIRKFFTRNTCVATGTGAKYNFVNDYIPCAEPAILANSDLRINRIDFVGANAHIGSKIQRVDFILDFDKLGNGSTYYFANYLNNLEAAAEKYSISIMETNVIEKAGNTSATWRLVKVAGKAVTLTNLAENLSALDRTKNYGIRLSVNPNIGKFLRTDGRVGTDKLCWNIDRKMSGPCLIADDSGNSLVLKKGSATTHSGPALCWDLNTKTNKLCLSQEPGKDKEGKEATLLELKDTAGQRATLLANVLVEDSSIVSPKTKILRTIPSTAYASFSNSTENFLVIPNPGGYVGNVTAEEGESN
ncbi:prepilin-type N-terminal cleavage/methylation domain [Edwardsiella tarda]|nr:prepilin-type N-terminal cleavage/methylation domain [Edwardsiella tarda]